ncbi:MAG: hypothetical protein R8P61_30845 [Bacteroidia bacterium]|nr:hypothetical protein [Bacteroidia bacterium]
MIKNPKKYLFDIQLFCLRIDEYLLGIDSIEKYSQSFVVKDAIERNIEKIAESMKKLKDLFQIELPIYDRTYNFRNSILHQYDEVKDKTIYSFVLHDIPKILEEVERQMDVLPD